MDNVLENYEPEKRIRPTFLTVLCILTFIGSGWGLISNSLAISNPAKQANEIQKQSANKQQPANPNSEESQFESKIMKTLSTTFTEDNIRKSAMGGLASSIICLLGAFMMWKLKRTGYYLYIVGALVGAIVPFVIFGTDNLIAMVMTVVSAFFGLLFIVLYGLNLRSMK